MPNPRIYQKRTLLEVAVLLLALTGSVTSICDPVTDPSVGDEAIPDYLQYFQSDFTLILEMTESYYNRTNYVKHSYHYFDGHEYEEETNAVHINKDGVFLTYHYFPKETRYIEETDRECIEPSVEKPVYMPFGWFDDNPDLGVPMYGPGAILRATHSENARYDGPDHHVNGIKCEKWYICYKGETEVHLYFSERDAFNMPEKSIFTDGTIADRIPVMFEVYPDEARRTKYSVVDFQPGLSRHSHIETPRGLACEGKVSINPTETVPDIHSHFSLAQEVISNSFVDGMNFEEDQFLDKFKVTYSERLAMTRLESTPPADETEEHHRPDKIIHDFNTGVQYAISRVYGTCERNFIPPYSLDKTYAGVGGYGVMAGPNEIFHIDDSYAYVGPHDTRSIFAKLFSSTRSDIPDPQFHLETLLPKAVLEHYYALGKEVSRIPMGIPIRSDLFIYNQTNPDEIERRVTANYYDAKELATHSINEYSVTECFDKHDDDWSTLYIFFPADEVQFMAVAESEDEFSRKVYEYLLGAGDISPARIGSIDISDGSSGWYSNTSDSDTIIAEIKLMQRAPYVYGYRIPDDPLQVPGDDEIVYGARYLDQCAEMCSLAELVDCKSFHYCEKQGTCYLSNNDGAQGPQTKNYTCDHYISNHENQTFDDLPTDEVDKVLRKFINAGNFSFRIRYMNIEVNFTATLHIIFKTPDPLDPIKIQFYTFEKHHAITDPDETLKLSDGSSTACMTACVNWMEFKCETIVHNSLTGECYLYTQHAEEVNSSRIEVKEDCYIHARSYVSDYKLMTGGISINTTGPVIVGYTPEECAWHCSRSEDYNCNSFEFCWETSSCHLHVETFVDVSDGGNYSTHQSCVHFEKKAEEIFTRYPHSGMPNENHKLVAQLTSVSQCAKLCLEDTSETCQSYDYCSACKNDDFGVCGDENKKGVNMCFLGNHHLGEPGLKLSTAPNCDHYSRDLFGDQDYASWIASQRKHNKPYTGGSMAGLAIGMIFLGIILGLGFLLMMAKYRPHTLPRDMSLAPKPSVGPQSTVIFKGKSGETDI